MSNLLGGEQSMIERLIEQQERIKQLEARLEVDHCYVMIDGNLVRKELSAEDRARFPDAVSCRDETIRLQDEEIKRLIKRLEEKNEDNR